MSFLLGNYISLTNLSEEDIERMVRMRISPINVSVHVTDPEIRRQMVRSPRAGECMEIMRRFTDAGIKLNCQIVVCPGLNDGEVLKNSISDLLELSDNVESISPSATDNNVTFFNIFLKSSPNNVSLCVIYVVFIAVAIVVNTFSIPSAAAVKSG